MRVARQGEPGEVYHFSTPLYQSIREVVEAVCRKLGADFNDVVEVVGERPGKDSAYLLDSAKARQVLGWSDRIGFAEGLDETIAWLSRNLDALRAQPWEYLHKP
jgi:dTDP-glucose 4,6-dehydratase